MKNSTTKTPSQLAQAAINVFSKSFAQRYGHTPNINRYTAKFNMMDILQGMSYEELVALIEYYFNISTNHSIQDFAANYDKLIELKQEAQKDAAARAKMREETRRRVEQFEQRS